MDENQEMKRFADRLWEYFKPKIEELTRSNVWYFRAQVTKPALDGKITVQRPFDGEIALPYVSSMENATVGTQVTVFVFGSSMTNAVICGNGSLSILGGSPSSGGGGGSVENAVLYVAQILSSAQQAQARSNIGAISADSLSEKQDTIEVAGLLKGDGNGGVTAAVPGTDYLQNAPVTSVDGKTGAVDLSDSYATPMQLAEKQQKIMVDGILEGDGNGNVQAATTLEGTLVEYSGGGGGTTDYNGLENRPQVNGVTLEGNKTSSELGLYGTENAPPYPVKSVDGATGTVVTNAVKTTIQNLTANQKAQARTNIGAGTSNFSGSYDDLSNKPTPYTLPVATNTTLGGVKPITKTDSMTQSVGVDENGRLYTSPGSGGGGTGGAVTSVNGKTGDVELTASDVGALPSDTELPTPFYVGCGIHSENTYDQSVTHTKTYDEILAAYKAGHACYARVKLFGAINTEIELLPLADLDEAFGYVDFALTKMTQGNTPEELMIYYVHIDSDGNAEGYWGTRYTLSGNENFLSVDDTVAGSYINIQSAMTAGSLLKVTAVDADGNPTALAAAIPGTDYMPAVPVTASDNGKTLKVVNGVWTAST